MKSWVVKQLASALSDYLEGVTTDSVQATLGTDTGELTLDARVNPAALKPFRVELLHSRVKLHVSIPWRHLETQPTEFDVADLELGLRLLPPNLSDLGSSSVRSFGGVGPEKRAAKEEAVRKQVEALNSSSSSSSSGRLARASNAILRKLCASVAKCQISLDRSYWASDPAFLVVKDVRFESVGSDFASAPNLADVELYKVFRLGELSVRTQSPTGKPNLGPLKLDVRLRHSPATQLLEVQAKALTDAEASYARIDASTARSVRQIVALVTQPDAADANATVLPEDAGHEYARLYARQLRGEAYDVAKLQEIEDAATVNWIAAWRKHVMKLQVRPAVAAAAEMKEEEKKKKGGGIFWKWFTGTSSPSAVKDEGRGRHDSCTSHVSHSAESFILDTPVPSHRGSWPDDDEDIEDRFFDAGGSHRDGKSGGGGGGGGGGDGFDDLLDEAIAAGLAPEVNLPTRVVLNFEIPRADVVCIGSSSKLAGTLEGVDLHVTLSAKAPKVCQSTPQLWQAKSTLKLGSFAVLMDSQPLIELRRDGSFASAVEREASTRSALQLTLDLEQRDVMVKGVPPIGASVSFQQDLVTCKLTPWHLHGALTSVLEVVDALSEDPTEAAASSARLAAETDATPRGAAAELPQPEDDASDQEDIWGDTKAVVLADKEAMLKLHIQIKAPILCWDDAARRETIELHFGSLEVRTCHNPLDWDDEGIPLPEQVPVTAFGVFCQLAASGLALRSGQEAPGSKDWVLSPVTMQVRTQFKDSGLQLYWQVPETRLDLFPRFMSALGGLKVGLDFGLSPLSRRFHSAPTLESGPKELDGTTKATAVNPQAAEEVIYKESRPPSSEQSQAATSDGGQNTDRATTQQAESDWRSVTDCEHEGRVGGASPLADAPTSGVEARGASQTGQAASFSSAASMAPTNSDGGAAGIKVKETRLEFNFGSFDLVWRQDDSKQSDILMGCGGTKVKVTSAVAGTHVLLDLSQLRTKVGEHHVLDVEDDIQIKVDSFSHRLSVNVTAPPVTLAWAPLPLPLQAWKLSQKSLANGADAAGKAYATVSKSRDVEMVTIETGDDSSISVSTLLWNRYIQERAERLGEDVTAYVQAEIERLGPDAADSGTAEADGEGHSELPTGKERAPSTTAVAHKKKKSQEETEQVVDVQVTFQKTVLIVESGAAIATSSARPLPTDSFRGGAAAASSFSSPATTPSNARLEAASARIQLTKQGSGFSVTALLASVNLDLGPRRILMPRNQDVDLLEVNFLLQKGLPMTLSLSWAQVVLAYRQRDLDGLLQLVRGAIEPFTSSSSSPGAAAAAAAGIPTTSSSSSVPPTGSASLRRSGRSATVDLDATVGAGGLHYEFFVEAPLVYLPTDLKASKASARLDKDSDLDLLLPALHLVNGEPQFQAPKGEGFLILDLGRLNAKRGDDAGTINLELRHAMIAAKMADQEAAVPILNPLSVGVSISILNNGCAVSCKSPLQEEDDCYHLQLTRAQLSLIFDVASYNFVYASHSGGTNGCRRPSASSFSSSRRPSGAGGSGLLPAISAGAVASTGSGATNVASGEVIVGPAPEPFQINFSWAWLGALRFDVGFNATVPLATLELVNGLVDYESSANGMALNVAIACIRGVDARLKPKNADRRLLEAGSATEEGAPPGLDLRMAIPIELEGDMTLEINVSRPTLLLLPALYMDLLAWGLSSYQQSGFFVAGQQTQSTATSPTNVEGPPARGMVLQVAVKQASVKLLTSVIDPSQFFEIAGDINCHIVQTAMVMHIKALNLDSGRLGYIVNNKPPTLVCSRLELASRGRFDSTVDQGQGVRVGMLTFDELKVKPLRIGLAPAGHRALMQAIVSLGELAVDTAEPAEELRVRDPMAFVLQSRFRLCISELKFEDIVLEVLEGSGSNRVRAVLQLQCKCPLMRILVLTSAGEPATMEVDSWGLTLQGKSYNEHAGGWEPVLGLARWDVSFMARPSGSGEPFEVRIREAHDSSRSNFPVSMPPEYQRCQLVRAWYGPGGQPPFTKGGRDVTHKVRQLLAESKRVAASNDLFGDPAVGSSKVLVLELKEQAVSRLEMRSEPIHLVVTVPFLNVITRLSREVSLQGQKGARARIAGARAGGQRGDVLLGLNLTGRRCFVQLKGKPGRRVMLECSSSPVALDTVLEEWDGASALPLVSLHLIAEESDAALDGREFVTSGRPCIVPLEGDSSQGWSPGHDKNFKMVVKVLAPTPLQRVLLVTTAIHIVNRTSKDIDLQFYRNTGENIVPASVGNGPRSIPTWLVDFTSTLDFDSDGEEDETEEGGGNDPVEGGGFNSLSSFPSQLGSEVMARPSMPSLSHSRPSVAHPTLPLGTKRISGRIVVEVLSAETLQSPEFRLRQPFPNLAPYVTARFIADNPRSTRVGRNIHEGGAVHFGERLSFPIPPSSTLQSLKGKELTFDVFNKMGMLGIRSDPKIGSARLLLGDEEVLEADPSAMALRTLNLTRGGKFKGKLTVMVGVKVDDENSVSASPSLLDVPGAADSAVGACFSSVNSVKRDAMADLALSRSKPSEGTFLLPAGHLLAVPPDVLVTTLPTASSPSPGSRASLAASPFSSPSSTSSPSSFSFSSAVRCIVATRPSTEAGYEPMNWGPQIDTGTDRRSICSLSNARGGGQMLQVALNNPSTPDEPIQEIVLDAPFRIANACPCRVQIRLGYKETERLAEVTTRCSQADRLVVVDSAGGAWEVPPNDKVEILPLKLDSKQEIVWCIPGVEGQHRIRCRNGTNYLRVLRNGNQVTWQFVQVHGIQPIMALGLEPQQELEIFDLPAEQLLMTVIPQQDSDGATQNCKWSEPVPVLMPPAAMTQATLRPICRHQQIEMNVAWQANRRIVIFAKNWFVDCTGLGVGMGLSSNPSARLPAFGAGVSLCGEFREENSVVALQIPGEGRREVAVPMLGTSTRVALSSLHTCTLMVEPVSSSSTFDVPCRLMTVVPTMMAYSELPNFEVGICQQLTHHIIWLGPGMSTHLYWQAPDKPRQWQLVLRPLTQPGKEPLKPLPTDLSLPFGLSEKGVGAYPLAFTTRFALKDGRPGKSFKQLACLQVDQSGELFTFTITEAKHCHQLINRHPCLVVDATFHGEGEKHVVLPNNSCYLGRAAEKWDVEPRLRERLNLELVDAFDVKAHVACTLDLSRTAQIKLNNPAAIITVQLANRVAIITVSPPGLTLDAGSAVSWGSELEVVIPRLSISLIGERPHREVFRLSLQALRLHDRRLSSGLETLELNVNRLQLDHHHRNPEGTGVVLASVSSRDPAIKARVTREDTLSRDTRLRSMDLAIARLEVTADDGLLESIASISESLKSVVIASGINGKGLSLRDAINRAGVPYNLVSGGPPPPSSKLVVSEVRVTPIDMRVFCRLSTRLLPEWLLVLFAVLSFSSNIQVDGASFNFSGQHLFEQGRAPFEGSIGGLMEVLSKHYVNMSLKGDTLRPLVSVVFNSNLLLGGFLSRHFFFPKDRHVQNLSGPALPTSKAGLVHFPNDIEDALDFIGE